MKNIREVATAFVLVTGVAVAADSSQITDEASAVAAAKRYTKAQCRPETPCHFQARREGKQWNVLVEFTKRNNPRETANKYSGGHVLLYFNEQGQLVRRVQGE